MQPQGNLGWRKLPPGRPVFEKFEVEADRAQLYKLKNLAARAFSLSKGEISVLTALISYFHEPLRGRLIVWPSNESLQNLTGYSERALRLAFKGLIRAGVLSSKDSANGKRFAIRSKSGQILDAYGFDLSPLLNREAEIHSAIAELDADAELRKRQLDGITISRRSVQEILRALHNHDSTIDVSDLQSRFDRLAADTPRRSLIRAPGALLADWHALKEEAEQQYDTAFAGNSCRHIENNNEIPEQPCQNGNENVDGEIVTLGDLKAACPDAVGWAERLNSEGDLVREAARLRGAHGTHRTAWEEACEDLGRPRAAVTFFYLLQVYEDDQRGKATLKNFGGFFRAYARKVADGEIDIGKEIHAMKRRRRH